MKNLETACEFNTKLARKLQNLKKDCDAKFVNQNYKGTGSQKHRRQVYIKFHDGLWLDLWLENDYVEFGGVTKLPVGLPKRLAHEEHTVDEVYNLVRDAF